MSALARIAEERARQVGAMQGAITGAIVNLEMLGGMRLDEALRLLREAIEYGDGTRPLPSSAARAA